MSRIDLTKRIVVSILILIVALVANYFAGVYAFDRASNYVTDIVLSNIPVFNVDYIFSYGAIALIIFVVYLVFRHPHNLPFVVKSLSLFIIIRAMFISMTHLGPFPTHAALDNNLISLISSGSDMFFSGHTGIPFLLALIYWKDIRLRILFIACSIFFGVIVLMGHVHYTIDVAAAFFITFAIYRMSLYFFHKDYKHFSERIATPPIL